MGQKVGVFISTSLFIALHSVDFCNTYLRSEFQKNDSPALTLSHFMFTWSVIQLAVTFYIAIFVSEISEHAELTKGEEEHHYTLKQVFIILGDIVKNRNL